MCDCIKCLVKWNEWNKKKEKYPGKANSIWKGVKWYKISTNLITFIVGIVIATRFVSLNNKLTFPLRPAFYFGCTGGKKRSEMIYPYKLYSIIYLYLFISMFDIFFDFHTNVYFSIGETHIIRTFPSMRQFKRWFCSNFSVISMLLLYFLFFFFHFTGCCEWGSCECHFKFILYLENWYFAVKLIHICIFSYHNLMSTKGGIDELKA